MSLLPKDPKARKNVPLARGLLDYFPDALAAVAELSQIANEQHNPGEPMHWAKEKSTDEADALMRHMLDRGTVDTDGVRHSAKVAWRALAMLQRELEAPATAVKLAALSAVERGDSVLTVQDVRRAADAIRQAGNEPPVVMRWNPGILGEQQCGIDPTCTAGEYPHMHILGREAAAMLRDPEPIRPPRVEQFVPSKEDKLRCPACGALAGFACLQLCPSRRA